MIKIHRNVTCGAVKPGNTAYTVLVQFNNDIIMWGKAYFDYNPNLHCHIDF